MTFIRHYLVALFCSICIAPFVVADDRAAVDFSRDIRPLLSDKCFRCHGPDQNERKGGLRLDVRDSATSEAESGNKAVVPGRPEESELIARIYSEDPELIMPPPDSGRTLSVQEKERIRSWIASGAEFRDHWAFITPERPSVPGGNSRQWGHNEVDAFVLSALEKQGWQPAAEASREDLLRRLSFDLTGLPPALSDIDRFTSDSRPNAYELEVERLLGSPHFGERMAVDWLDVARFADTNGYHLDNGRDMSAWRSWVINAFNSNMPFDQFTIEQLAGDLLPESGVEQQIASGFNRNHMINFEGGAIPDEYLTAYIVDRVNTTGATWLGLTVGCAQCHDHKYDPLTQKDFYQLFAFFNNVPENGLDGNRGNAMPFVRVPTSSERQQLEKIENTLSEVHGKLSAEWAEPDAEQLQWEKRQKEILTTAGQGGDQALSEGNATVVAGEWSLAGPMVHKEGPNRAYNVNLGPERKPVVLTDTYTLHDLSYGWTPRAELIDGQVVQLPGKRAATYLFRTITAAKPVRVTLSIGSRDAIRVWLNEKEIVSSMSGREISPDQHTIDVDLNEGANQLLIKSVGLNGDAAVIFTMSGGESQNVPAAVQALVRTATTERTPEQSAALRTWYRRTVSRNESVLKAIAQAVDLQKQRTDLESRVRTSMVMAELPAPRDTFMLMRGQYDRKGEKVAAAVPAFLPAAKFDENRPLNRLDLGRWLVDRRNPLVARVIVNRFWQSIFGVGLVKTSEDFGSQGERPSHPELLDWLAVEFMDSADAANGRWNVKALIKKMVMSATYRQTSRVSHDFYARDPENRWLGRGARYRLQAEFVRDQALAVSGLLRHQIGGASVSPYQPDGLWTELSSRGDSGNWTAQVYEQSRGDDLYRRTMYTFWKRTSPPPTLVTFDAPDREICTVRRSRTNTPLQALILMNDPTYVEASRAFAEQLLKAPGSDRERLQQTFRMFTSRSPVDRELAALHQLLDRQREYFTSNPEAAAKLLSAGESKRDESLDLIQHAAWTMTASAVMNLDEVVTRN